MHYPPHAAIDYRITPENWDGELRIRSELDGSVRNTGVARYRQFANRHLEVVGRGRVSPEGVYLIARTTQSRFEVGEAARTRVIAEADGVEDAARAGTAAAEPSGIVQRRILDGEPDLASARSSASAPAGARRSPPSSPTTAEEMP